MYLSRPGYRMSHTLLRRPRESTCPAPGRTAQVDGIHMHTMHQCLKGRAQTIHKRVRNPLPKAQPPPRPSVSLHPLSIEPCRPHPRQSSKVYNPVPCVHLFTIFHPPPSHPLHHTSTPHRQRPSRIRPRPPPAHPPPPARSRILRHRRAGAIRQRHAGRRRRVRRFVLLLEVQRERVCVFFFLESQQHNVSISIRHGIHGIRDGLTSSGNFHAM